MASKPSTRPIRGPKNATNCANENSAPVDVNNIRKTSDGFGMPSSSLRSPLAVLNVMMTLIMRITVRSSVNRTLLIVPTAPEVAGDLTADEQRRVEIFRRASASVVHIATSRCGRASSPSTCCRSSRAPGVGSSGTRTAIS